MRRFRLALSLVGFSLLGAASCDFIVDTSTEQCSSDGDCSKFGPGYTCTDDNVCQVPGGDPCATSQECIDRNDGAPYTCVENQCVSLLNEHCKEVIPASAIGKDNTIFFGFMGPLEGEFASLGIPIKQGVQLALEDVENRANGVPSTEGPKRSLAMVACHDFNDTEGVANFLVNDLRVPAIFGPAFSGITLDTADITIPAGVLLISASATSPDITGLSDNDLVWRTCPSDKLQAQPIALLVSATEARLREDLGIPAAEEIRVAAINKGDSYGAGLAQNIAPLLTFNGKSVTENGDANYLGRQYPDPSEDPNFDFSGIVAEVLDFKPHIILPLGTNEGLTQILQPVESQWASSNPSDPRPYYIIPDGGRLSELTDLVEALQATDSDAALSLRARVRGTVPGLRGPNYQAFSIAYKTRFGDDPGTFSEHAYDSGYLMAYSVVSGGEPTSGSSIASGLMNMSSGNVLAVGPNDLNNGLNALAAGGKIDFDGASGPLDFDNSTGEAPVDFDIWCVTYNGATNSASFSSSGQIWSASSGQLEGSPDACDEVPEEML